ncbi:MAG TPA: hypothetical protein VF256_09130 [Streptosporangiaceae bacterium]
MRASAVRRTRITARKHTPGYGAPLSWAILELNGHIVRIRLLQWVVVCRVDHEIAAALGVARVGEQGNYRPPRRPEENGQASLLALEAALGTARQALGPDDKPDGDDARVRQPSDAPTGQPGDAHAEQPGDARAGKPGNAGAGKPGAAGAGKPGYADAGQSGDAGAGQPGDAGAGKPGGARVAQAEVGGDRPGAGRAKPPWPTVVATTVRLWLRRRWAALARLFRRRWAIVVAVLAVAVLVVGGLTVSLLRHTGTGSAAGQQAARVGLRTGPAGQNAAATAAGHAAAVWVARQVSRDAMVACDPGMCHVLEAQGLPAGNLLLLRSRTTGLRFCNVIVATQNVRNLLGSRILGQSAPAVIAGFGSGTARIDVRAVAPGGAAAYRAALAADWAARRKAAAELMKSPRIHAGDAAMQELRAGMVDSRVLITLAALAASHPVNVMAFGDAAPGAAADVPLREMEITGARGPAQGTAELRRMRSFVLAQRAVFLPAHVTLVRLAGGAAALRIEFGAPSPLGLLVGRPVTQ